MNCSTLTTDYIQKRIAEIDKELAKIRELKRENRMNNEDIEDVSEKYQLHLELNYEMSDLNDERKILEKELTSRC